VAWIVDHGAVVQGSDVRRLIINGDDYGFTEGVVRAILDAHRVGVVTSTTALVNMPAWDAGAALLRETPSLRAGVHLVFNDGAPVLPPERVPTLVDSSGRFMKDVELRQRADTLNTAELKAEFRAQIERFRSAGLQPTHLDNHCSISYENPEWFRVTVELAAEYDLPMRLPFGDDLPQLVAGLVGQTGLPAERVLAQGLSFQRLLQELGVRRPDRFVMTFSRDGGRTVDNLLAILERLPEGTSELLTHPGYGIPWRQAEIEVLLDPRVRQYLRRSDLELVSFAAL